MSTDDGPVSPRESREQQGGDEGMRVATYEGAERSVWKSPESNEGQSGRSDHTGGPRDNVTMPKEAKDTQAEGTNTDVGDPCTKQKGVRGAEREEERVKVSREDQATSLLEINTEGRHATVLNRGTRSVAPLRKSHFFLCFFFVSVFLSYSVFYSL